MSLQTPVALFLFNRPDPTARVFARVAEMRPRRLFLIADGPRNVAERDRCDAARQVVSRIDWDCEVRRNFSDANLGCRDRMSSGIDWVFCQVEEAILLEDDCLPHPSFFPFCGELLARYRDDERIMMISGDNFQRGRRRTPFSYYFSRIPHVWGWASWRRAWRSYDVTMSNWPRFRDTGWLESTLRDAAAAKAYRRLFDDTHAGKIDTWDYQLTFAAWQNNCFSVLPDVNLVTNLGFGPDATHTKAPDSPDAALPVEPVEFPLRHPTHVEPCIEADEFTFESSFRIRRSSAA